MASPRITEAKGILAARLREIRNEASLTGRSLASRAGWHYSKVSKIEHASQMPNENDIRVWCRVCDAEEYVVDLIAAVRNIDSMYTEWRRLEATGLRHMQESFHPLYRETQQFRVFQHSAVPGLLQTAGYARAHLRTVIEFRGIPDDLEEAVRARLRHQEVLTSGGKRFMFIVGEQALRTPVCGAEEMSVQLARLAELTVNMPQLSFGVIPARGRPALMPPENFWIYDDNQVRVDTIPGQYRIKTPTDVALYEKAFSALADAAVYGQAARDLINATAGEIRGT
ncbi:transcriptional regulator [Sphaerisporangium siamense]|uniref:Transcriptional regulator with XRE-family HTH domain n=1 Tax=Sphaerisporangium siamense TaxID=795645 RepID=A0A7W7DFE1_9ACTN|nr:helix-turn-helix transcriptional regulator [Sphaerisporangium siamense]MBB4704721.1 transcriptional regulator with XRE-family HTH domain [Sphaerisporangium siamense]GII86334.1 transcriptional regulator [Sphaerisporangium siamense]